MSFASGRIECRSAPKEGGGGEGNATPVFGASMAEVKSTRFVAEWRFSFSSSSSIMSNSIELVVEEAVEAVRGEGGAGGHSFSVSSLRFVRAPLTGERGGAGR